MLRFLEVAVGEDVQDRLPIFEGDNSYVFAKFFNKAPVANPTIWLYFLPNGIMHGSLTPFSLKIRASDQNLLFKIACGFHRPIAPLRPEIQF